MKFDRNTIIGFSLLAVLFIAFFYISNKNQQAALRDRQHKDSIELAQKIKADSLDALKNPVDTASLRRQQAIADSIGRLNKAGIFSTAAGGEHADSLFPVSNDLFTVTFTTKGAQPRSIELKHFKDKDSGNVKLAASTFNQIAYKINTAPGQSASTADLYFAAPRVESKPDGSQVVSFDLIGGDSTSKIAYITHQYTIRKDDYMIDFNVIMQSPSTLLENGDLNLTWKYAAAQQESSLSFEKENTQIGYVENGEFDYHTIGRRSDLKFDEGPVHWLGIRQRFFNTFLIAKDNFTSGTMEWTIPPDASKTVVEATSLMKLKVPAANQANIAMQLFYGPSDFKMLQKYDIKLSKMVNLGQGMYAFVRPLNRYIVLPVWDGIKSFVGSFGIVIALLTLFIRLLISPLSYKSYLSGAKMKALRPEIAKLREKTGGDQQQMGIEQMKLFKEAGVSPFGGCVPALLQIPIFFALYSFFNSSVDLRGADFLWSQDLSAFDAPIRFGVNIPLLGDHLSLFTITAVLTSLLISVYSMSMAADQSNPLMKWMPYIFPVFLLFIFNRLPSALTWYYTVSNLITLALQFVIQNYIIDHNKILAKIDENRKKPKTKSKWQERLEAMQEQQKKIKEMQDKNKKK